MFLKGGCRYLSLLKCGMRVVEAALGSACCRLRVPRYRGVLGTAGFRVALAFLGGDTL